MRLDLDLDLELFCLSSWCRARGIVRRQKCRSSIGWGGEVYINGDRQTALLFSSVSSSPPEEGGD
jgi:hypothetical protein